MTCAEFQEQVAALALGALEPAEEAACADHLETEPLHRGCHEAYARALVTAGKLGASLAPVKPGPKVWAGIEAALDAERRTASPRRWAGALGWAVAAAAALALVYLWQDRDRTVQTLTSQRTEAVNLATVVQQRQRECLDQLNAIKGGDQLARDAVSLADKPGTQLVNMEGAGYHATIVFNAASRRAYVVSATMAPLAGKDFELWVIRDAKTAPIAAGLMRTRQGQVAIGEVDAAVLGGGSVAAVAMSLEPVGGSTTGKPTTVLMAGKLPG